MSQSMGIDAMFIVKSQHSILLWSCYNNSAILIKLWEYGHMTFSQPPSQDSLQVPLTILMVLHRLLYHILWAILYIVFTTLSSKGSLSCWYQLDLQCRNIASPTPLYSYFLLSPMAQCVAQWAPICCNANGGWFAPRARHSVRMTYIGLALLCGCSGVLEYPTTNSCGPIYESYLRGIIHMK